MSLDISNIANCVSFWIWVHGLRLFIANAAQVPQLLFYVIYFFLYSSAAEYLFKHIYVISKGGLTKGVICLALLGYFHASLSSSLSLSGSSSSLLAVKVVDSSIGPSPCLFRGHALVCFYGISSSIHLNIYLFEEGASLISVFYLKYRT